MPDKRLEITPSTCIGCKTCELSCAFFHAKVKSRLAKPRISVIKTGETAFIPYTCFQCVDPGCEKACPVGALTRNSKTGAIDLNEDVCIRCMACVTACPFGNIYMDAGKVTKCDLCQGDPACAKFCPTGTLQYKNTKE